MPPTSDGGFFLIFLFADIYRAFQHTNGPDIDTQRIIAVNGGGVRLGEGNIIIEPHTKRVLYDGVDISVNGVVHVSIVSKILRKWARLPHPIRSGKSNLLNQLKANEALLHYYGISVVIYSTDFSDIVKPNICTLLVPESHVPAQGTYAAAQSVYHDNNDFYFQTATERLPQMKSGEPYYLVHMGERKQNRLYDADSPVVMIGIGQDGMLAQYEQKNQPFLLVAVGDVADLEVFANLKYIDAHRPHQRVYFKCKLASQPFPGNINNFTKGRDDWLYFFVYCKSVRAAVRLNKLLNSNTLVGVQTPATWNVEIMMFVYHIYQEEVHVPPPQTKPIHYCTWFRIDDTTRPGRVLYDTDSSLTNCPIDQLIIFDIETVSPETNRVPTGEKNTDIIISISVFEQQIGSNEYTLSTGVYLPVANEEDLPAIHRGLMAELNNIPSESDIVAKSKRHVLLFHTEAALIKWFVREKCLRANPFFLSGYSIIQYDLKVLMRRIVKLRLFELYDELFLFNGGVSAIGHKMIPIDVFSIMEKNYRNQTVNLKLSTVTKKWLQSGTKMDLDSRLLRVLFRTFLHDGVSLQKCPQSGITLCDLIRYNELDVVSVFGLIQRLNLITNELQTATSQNLQPFRVSTSPISVYLRYMLVEQTMLLGTILTHHRHLLYLTYLTTEAAGDGSEMTTLHRIRLNQNNPLDPKRRHFGNDDSNSYAGGFNNCSRQAYFDSCIVLDFNSFYPNVINHLNISHESCSIQMVKVLKHLHAFWDFDKYVFYRYTGHQYYYSTNLQMAALLSQNEKYRCMENIIDSGSKLMTREELSSLPENEWVIMIDKHKGILSKVTERLVNQRSETKRVIAELLKRKKTIEVETEINRLKCHEMIIKLSANSLYGLLGSEYNEFANKGLAASITCLCRHHIILAANVAHLAGYDVIYIDTDSLFCVPSNDCHEEVLLSLGITPPKGSQPLPNENELCALINERLKPLVLDNKTMRRVFILRMKTYFAMDGDRFITRNTPLDPMNNFFMYLNYTTIVDHFVYVNEKSLQHYFVYVFIRLYLWLIEHENPRQVLTLTQNIKSDGYKTQTPMCKFLTYNSKHDTSFTPKGKVQFMILYEQNGGFQMVRPEFYDSFTLSDFFLFHYVKACASNILNLIDAKLIDSYIVTPQHSKSTQRMLIGQNTANNILRQIGLADKSFEDCRTEDIPPELKVDLVSFCSLLDNNHWPMPPPRQAPDVSSLIEKNTQ